VSPRIAIIDDEAGVRNSVAAVLATYGYQSRGFASAPQFLAAVARDSFACIVMDIRMPEMDGLQAFQALRGKGVATPVIFVTGHGDIRLAVRCIKAGAADFIEKPINDELLVESIVAAMRSAHKGGQQYIDRVTFAARLARLTPRERTIIELLADGHTSNSIAAVLGISSRTADHHRANVLEKMEAASLAQLIKAFAVYDLGDG
jgi:two-component system response regulator FixJ